MRQNTADDNDNDTRMRDHETSVREYMPRDGSAVKAGNACPKAHTANAGALPGQKVLKKKMRCHFRWSPSPAHADLMFLDLPISPAEFQSDRRQTEPARPCACWAPAIRDPPTWGASVAKKWPYGCDGIRSCCAVNHFRGGPAPKAGRHRRQGGTQGRPSKQRQMSVNRKKRHSDTNHTHTPAHPDTQKSKRILTRSAELVVSNFSLRNDS